MTSIFPKLSFSTTMKSSILLPEQGERVSIEACSIEACSGPDFRDWIEETLNAYLHVKRSHQARVESCLTELAGLSYEEPLARWFAVLVLQEHKISMDLVVPQKVVVNVCGGGNYVNK